MQQLTQAGQNITRDISARYNLSQDAVLHMLVAVNNGNGSMAQFNCPELGGSGQWMRGGMTMVGDMFNNGLKATVDNLCNELANALANNQMFPVVPAGTPGSHQWWPASLGSPFSSGAQNNIRYAIFPGRLAVEQGGQVTIYDTLDHQIGGVSQQQGGNTALTFSSQYGTISVNSLPIISGTSEAVPPSPPQTNFAEPPHVTQNFQPASTAEHNASAHAQRQPNNNTTKSNDDANKIIQLLEQLGRLRDAGVLTEDEFNNKKSELMSRL